MRTNLFKDRISIQRRTITPTATGQVVIWAPEHIRFGRVVPIDAAARIQYQQIKSMVTHRIIFEGGLTLDMAKVRFKHGGKTYLPIEPSLSLEDNTVILVKES